MEWTGLHPCRGGQGCAEPGMTHSCALCKDIPVPAAVVAVLCSRVSDPPYTDRAMHSLLALSGRFSYDFPHGWLFSFRTGVEQDKVHDEWKVGTAFDSSGSVHIPMKNKLQMVVLLAPVVGLFLAGQAGAGNLDAPAAPASSNSAMWTLEDIYNKLNTRTNVSRRTGGFMEPTGGPTNGTMHTLNDIMTLVTNRAPVAKTGQTQTVPYAAPAGSDGNLRKGVAWPNPRFTVLGDTNAPVDVRTNCVRDNLTGLMWARNANLAQGTAWSVSGTCTWWTAINVITNSAGPVNGANYGGYSDWRLPTVRELLSLLAWQYFNPALSDGTGKNQWTEARGPFTGVRSSGYWSSTQMGYLDSKVVHFGYCEVPSGYQTYAYYYVWPVRVEE